MKVLVTGASGFVGQAIIEQLAANDFEVIALVNQNTKFEIKRHESKNCRFISADIRDPKSLETLRKFGKFDSLIHSAGLAHQFKRRDEKDFWEVNVSGTQNIADAAAELSVENFVLISSVSVYGKDGGSSKKKLTEDAPCRPEGIYAQTKYESERTAKQNCERNRMNLTVLRLATVIGENDRGNVFRLIKAIDERKFLWIGDGRNLKSLIYKGDVARACLQVLRKKESGGIYNVTAEALTMKEIVDEIHVRLNKKIPRFHISPVFLNKTFQLNRKTLNIGLVNKVSKTLEKWLSDDVFSGEKFSQTYRFEIKTPILKAIDLEVESYLKSK